MQKSEASGDNTCRQIIPFQDNMPANDHVEKSHFYITAPLVGRIQAVLDRSLSLASSLSTQFLDYSYFHHSRMVGDVVILVGTSTAGKTSLIKALLRLEPDRKEDGIDLRYIDLELLDIKKHISEEEFKFLEQAFNSFWDIYVAVYESDRSWKPGIEDTQKEKAEEIIQKIKSSKMRDDLSIMELNNPIEVKFLREVFGSDSAVFYAVNGNPVWRSDVSKEDKEKAESDIQAIRDTGKKIQAPSPDVEAQMLLDAFDFARRGGKIILDVLKIEDVTRHFFVKQAMDQVPTRLALTYCPFHALSTRVANRNEEAKNNNPSNERPYELPLRQFGDVYTRTLNPKKRFEHLTRNQVVQAFDTAFDNTIQMRKAKRVNLPSPEELLKQKEENRNKLLTKLGFSEGIDAVDVAPREQHYYQLFLNTLNDPNSQRAASDIHRGTYTRKRNR